MIKPAIGRDEVLRAARAQRVLREWDSIVGPGLAEKSHPDRYDRGTVWVSVQGSAWAQELRMIKDRILQKLADKSGEPSLFIDLRFGVRPLPAKDAQEVNVEKDKPKPPRADKTGLSIREIAEQRLKEWPGESGTSQ